MTRKVLGLCVFAATAAGAATVEFNRDIRPLLSDRCFTCHGPDAATRKIRLRLDSEAGMHADLGGHRAVVPGDVEKSELVKRVTSSNKALQMPPAYSGFKLTDREIGLIKDWVAQGAKWQKHWSWNAPTRPESPPVKNGAWVRNPIDRFVLARLERDGLTPSAEATKNALIRRVTLDLTGLPPTPREVRAFLADNSPDAYEKLVDRLLAGSRYGERMAARWLDVARYADTNGYQTDAERFMWRWRDWVINAFNANKPFDQFTVEQLAGDLLPNPTLDQRIATAFNRNHRGNGEGGIVPEEYAVEYVADRVETTAAVWLGVTIGCARCHNHKYDPITQKEYYQLFAYFNNIADRGRYFKYGNTPPMVPAPTPDQQVRLTAAESKLGVAQTAFQGMKDEVEKAQASWETSLRGGLKAEWDITRSLAKRFPLDAEEKAADGITHEAGKFGQAANFNGKGFLEAGKIADYNFQSRFSIVAWIKPTSPDGAIMTRAKDISEESGLGLYLKDGKLQMNMVQRWLDDAIRVETEKPISLNQWHHVVATYDATRVADGVRIYVDGELQPRKALVDELNQDFRASEPWRIGAGNAMRFQGLIDDVRLYNRDLPLSDVRILALGQSLNDAAAIEASRRSQAQKDMLRLAFVETHGSEPIRKAWNDYTTARDGRDTLSAGFPTVMVMEEMAKPRVAFLLQRGAYDKPGEEVRRAVPASLHAMPAGAPDNRMGFARWLVDPANPLTARVIVNRYWQQYFGIGLVKTVEDFGSQGEWPSHPDLLDWLATEFVQSGWNVKEMQKKIVMSATYRQASKATPEMLQLDPENRRMARGPRLRLSGEVVRDQALAMSGLLVEKIGGPSVKPYQPDGLWRELTGGADYQRDQGEGLYRRTLYTFWKRTAPPPMMMNFDSPSRETCIVRESRTNTPLQALNLMNDVTYLEAARKIAERMIHEGGATPEERISYGFLLAAARTPRAAEMPVMVDAFRYQLDNYKSKPAEAARFLSQGDALRDTKIDTAELAAYAAVASMILNLDEVVTKP